MKPNPSNPTDPLGDPVVRALLTNLAARLRLARTMKTRYRASAAAVSEAHLEFLDGEATEAWNSFQHAKATVAAARRTLHLTETEASA